MMNILKNFNSTAWRPHKRPGAVLYCLTFPLFPDILAHRDYDSFQKIVTLFARVNMVDKQLSLPLSHTESSLRQHLEESVGKSVTLILTNNSASILTASTRDGVMHIRLHRMFLKAGSEVIDEIVAYLKNRRGTTALFRRFVRDNKELLNAKPRKKTVPKTAGRFHNLRGLYDEINRRYFGGSINAEITWGSKNPRRWVRKRTLGSYSADSNLIRINPMLDRKSVPRYYVSFVVYHEMLHAALGISEKGGRRSMHSKEFRRREKMFDDYEKAEAWERKRHA